MVNERATMTTKEFSEFINLTDIVTGGVTAYNEVDLGPRVVRNVEKATSKVCGASANLTHTPDYQGAPSPK